MRRWSKWILAVALAAAVACGFYGARASWLPQAAEWLDVGDPPGRVDLVMVLPGDAEVRPFVAAAMVNAGLADGVLVPATQDGPAVADGWVPADRDVIREILVRRGVSADCVAILAGASGSTIGDAVALREFLAARPDVRVAVVTSWYHTRRARRIFRAVLGDQAGQLQFVSAPTDEFTPQTWWQCERGFVFIAGECVKLTAVVCGDHWVALGCIFGGVVLTGALARARYARQARRLGRSDVPNNVCPRAIEPRSEC